MYNPNLQKYESIQSMSIDILDEEEAALTMELEELDSQEYLDILAAEEITEDDLSDETGRFYGDLDSIIAKEVAEIRATNDKTRTAIMQALEDVRGAIDFLQGTKK